MQPLAKPTVVELVRSKGPKAIVGLVTALPLGGCVASGKFFLFLWKMTWSDEKQAGARRLEYQMVPRIVFQETPFDIHYRRGSSGYGLPSGALPHLFQVIHRAGGHLDAY